MKRSKFIILIALSGIIGFSLFPSVIFICVCFRCASGSDRSWVWCGDCHYQHTSNTCSRPFFSGQRQSFSTFLFVFFSTVFFLSFLNAFKNPIHSLVQMFFGIRNQKRKNAFKWKINIRKFINPRPLPLPLPAVVCDHNHFLKMELFVSILYVFDVLWIEKPNNKFIHMCMNVQM